MPQLQFPTWIIATFRIHIPIVHKMHGFVSFASNHSESIHHRNLDCKRYVNQIVNLFLSLPQHSVSIHFCTTNSFRAYANQFILPFDLCNNSLGSSTLLLRIQHASLMLRSLARACLLIWRPTVVLFSASLASGQFRRVLNSCLFFRCSLLAD